MSGLTLHRSPSVGSLTKKLLAINPDLGTTELIAIIRAATRIVPGSNEGFAAVEAVDEARALELGRESLSQRAEGTSA